MKSPAGENTKNEWLSVPIMAMIMRLLCRELTFQNEYLRQENRIPDEAGNPSKWQSGRSFATVSAKKIIRKEFLGGLLRSYHKAA